MAKDTKNTAEKSPKVKKHQAVLPISGPVGVFLLFVAVSTLYADYLVYFGTDNLVSKVMLIPNVLAIAIFVLYKAAK